MLLLSLDTLTEATWGCSAHEQSSLPLSGANHPTDGGHRRGIPPTRGTPVHTPLLFCSAVSLALHGSRQMVLQPSGWVKIIWTVRSNEVPAGIKEEVNRMKEAALFFNDCPKVSDWIQVDPFAFNSQKVPTRARCVPTCVDCKQAAPPLAGVPPTLCCRRCGGLLGRLWVLPKHFPSSERGIRCHRFHSTFWFCLAGNEVHQKDSEQNWAKMGPDRQEY